MPSTLPMPAAPSDSIQFTIYIDRNVTIISNVSKCKVNLQQFNDNHPIPSQQCIALSSPKNNGLSQ